MIHRAFTPNTPVNSIDLFSGRHKQIDKVLGAVFSPGQHAAIYGERGVGKSSLANIIYDLVFAAGKQNFVPARVNCSQGITFAEIWREVFKQVPITREGDSFHLHDQIPDNPIQRRYGACSSSWTIQASSLSTNLIAQIRPQPR
jgi:energy-coupling factor transporter ATP-binding protein EcfA2